MERVDTVIFINSPEIPRLIYLLFKYQFFFENPLIPNILNSTHFFEKSSYFIKQNECRKGLFFHNVFL